MTLKRKPPPVDNTLTIILAVIATAVVQLTATLFAARRVLARITQAVEHLEQHATDDRNTTFDHDGESISPTPTVTDLSGFFAPPTAREHHP